MQHHNLAKMANRIIYRLSKASIFVLNKKICILVKLNPNNLKVLKIRVVE